MQKPFLLFLSALISGILAGDCCSLNLSGYLLLLVPVIILLASGFFLKKSILLVLGVMAILFLQGNWNITSLERPTPLSDALQREVNGGIVTLEGRISESPQYAEGKVHVVLQATRILREGAYLPVTERILLTVKGRQDLNYGDFIRCETRLATPHNFNNPGGFDYEKRLRFERISSLGFISDESRLIVLRKRQGNVFREKLERFRHTIRTLIIRHASLPERAVLQAMILGNQREIPQDIRDQFNRTGTSHILAISGFNVGMIALWSIVIFRWLFRRSETLLLRFNVVKISLLAAFPPVLVYSLIAGAGMSVVRAEIMVLVCMIAIVLDRRQDLLNTLAAAALVILMVSPQALFDVSFQLSFTAVASIACLAPLWAPFLRSALPPAPSLQMKAWLDRRKRDFFLFFFTTLGVTLGTLPIIAFTFNRLSFIVLPANVVLVPILGLLALPVSMMVIVITPFSQALAGILISCSAWLVKISLWLLDFFAGFPWASLYVCTPSPWQVGAFYLLLLSALQLVQVYRLEDQGELRCKKRLLWFVCLCLLSFLPGSSLWQHLEKIQSRDLIATAIDVHQGSATLIRLPGGKTMLVDGGGRATDGFDIGRSVVAPFLWHEGIRALDVVVLSHAHADHLGGLLFVLEHFPVKEVWSNGEGGNDEAYGRFLEILSRKGMRHRIFTEKKSLLQIGPVAIQLLNPNPRFSSRQDLNEKSLVLRLTLGTVSLMLPGDLSAQQESALLREGDDLRSQILFVPHHGSRLSSSLPFLRNIQPQVAVISCGPENFFGFPHREVVERYRGVGARIVRTDRQGAVTLKTDGRRISLGEFKPEPGRADS